MATKSKTLQLGLAKVILFAMLMMLSSATRREGQVKEAKRSVALLEPEVVIYTNEIIFKPGKEDKLPDGRIMFEYVVAEDYSETIALIEAQDKLRQSAKLSIQRYNNSNGICN